MNGGGGGGGMQAPPGAGAAGYYGVPGQPAPRPRPPWMYNCLQGPVQRPTLMYNGRTVVVQYSGPAPVKGQPGLRLCPSHRAAAPAPSCPGRTMLMRPPNLAGGQMFPPPSVPRPPPQQQPKQMDDKNKHRVITQLLAALKEQGSSACAAQQQRQ
ncbi:uncharacterized protein LOC133923617 [Phragmites australis]|uniref:uncharacterized protein LOC133923617 n=1 Tax=Phragmites australis TaxID=29695 RepID=UPI002D783674|nr:uncharacterized protein LOC133923617 [Phragmites australis]